MSETGPELGLRDEDRLPWLEAVENEDDGDGISAERGTGVGLLSMRERAEELGARFMLGPNREGQGTQVTVEFSLPGGQDTGHA